MISHKYRCIFIHIPKCAGTSIESALGHLEDYEGRGAQDHRSIRMIEQPYIIPKAFGSKENLIEVIRRQKHQYFVKGHNPRNIHTVTKEQYNTYFKFSIVRNPWSRVFSWYNNVINDDIHLARYKITKNISFKEFILRFAGKGPLRSQLHWLKSFDGSIPIDFIGRFECLSDDAQKIFKHLKKKNTSLPHKLKGAKGDYRQYYDNEAKDLILNIYKEEIDYFNYSFDS
jgi:hypothetical protein